MRAYLSMDHWYPALSTIVSLKVLKETGQFKMPKFEPVNMGELGIHLLLLYSKSTLLLPCFVILGQAPIDISLLQATLSGKGAGGYKKKFPSLILGLWAFLLLWPIGCFPASRVQKTPQLHLPGTSSSTPVLPGSSFLPASPFPWHLSQYLHHL